MCYLALIALHNPLRGNPAGNSVGGFNVVPLRCFAYDNDAFACRQLIYAAAARFRYPPYRWIDITAGIYPLRPQYEPKQYGGEASAAQCDDDTKQHKPLFIAETAHRCTDQQ